MKQDRDIEDRVRQRIRSLRNAQGWTLDELGKTSTRLPAASKYFFIAIFSFFVSGPVFGTHPLLNH